MRDVSICDIASSRGHMDVLKWAHSIGLPWGKDTSKYLAKKGLIEELKWAKGEGCSIDERVCTQAALRGNLDILKWARENGCRWNKYVCTYAAKNGHLEILKWAQENGCRWDANTCTYAAKNGHLEILKWARKNGCEWNPKTCAGAAKNGHLEILKWLRENGCNWNIQTSAYAAKHGHLKILKWVLENGCYWNEHTCTYAAENGHLHILSWLRSNFSLFLDKFEWSHIPSCQFTEKKNAPCPGSCSDFHSHSGFECDSWAHPGSCPAASTNHTNDTNDTNDLINVSNVIGVTITGTEDATATGGDASINATTDANDKAINGGTNYVGGGSAIFDDEDDVVNAGAAVDSDDGSISPGNSCCGYRSGDNSSSSSDSCGSCGFFSSFRLDNDMNYSSDDYNSDKDDFYYFNRPIGVSALKQEINVVLDKSVENIFRFSKYTCEVVANNGYMNVLIWAKENGFVLEDDVHVKAEKNPK